MATPIVIFHSQTGFAQQYATWISEELACPMVALEEASVEDVKGADLIIYGSGVRMSAMRDFPRFRQLLQKADVYAPGHVIVWANGGTPHHRDRDWKPAASSFTPTELARGDYQYFYLEGGVTFEGLPKLDHYLLRLFSKRVQRHRGRGPWAEWVADHIAEGYSLASREQIEPLVAKAREMLAALDRSVSAGE